MPIFVPVTDQSGESHVSVPSGLYRRIRFPGPRGEGRDSPEEPGGVNFQKQRGLAAGREGHSHRPLRPNAPAPQTHSSGARTRLGQPGGARGPA